MAETTATDIDPFAELLLDDEDEDDDTQSADTFGANHWKELVQQLQDYNKRLKRENDTLRKSNGRIKKIAADQIAKKNEEIKALQKCLAEEKEQHLKSCDTVKKLKEDLSFGLKKRELDSTQELRKDGQTAVVLSSSPHLAEPMDTGTSEPTSTVSSSGSIRSDTAPDVERVTSSVVATCTPEPCKHPETSMQRKIQPFSENTKIPTKLAVPHSNILGSDNPNPTKLAVPHLNNLGSDNPTRVMCQSPEVKVKRTKREEQSHKSSDTTKTATNSLSRKSNDDCLAHEGGISTMPSETPRTVSRDHRSSRTAPGPSRGRLPECRSSSSPRADTSRRSERTSVNNNDRNASNRRERKTSEHEKRSSARHSGSGAEEMSAKSTNRRDTLRDRNDIDAVKQCLEKTADKSTPKKHLPKITDTESSRSQMSTEKKTSQITKTVVKDKQPGKLEQVKSNNESIAWGKRKKPAMIKENKVLMSAYVTLSEKRRIGQKISEKECNKIYQRHRAERNLVNKEHSSSDNNTNIEFVSKTDKQTSINKQSDAEIITDATCVSDGTKAETMTEKDKQGDIKPRECDSPATNKTRAYAVPNVEDMLSNLLHSGKKPPPSCESPAPSRKPIAKVQSSDNDRQSTVSPAVGVVLSMITSTSGTSTTNCASQPTLQPPPARRSQDTCHPSHVQPPTAWGASPSPIRQPPQLFPVDNVKTHGVMPKLDQCLPPPNARDPRLNKYWPASSVLHPRPGCLESAKTKTPMPVDSKRPEDIARDPRLQQYKIPKKRARPSQESKDPGLAKPEGTISNKNAILPQREVPSSPKINVTVPKALLAPNFKEALHMLSDTKTQPFANNVVTSNTASLCLDQPPVSVKPGGQMKYEKANDDTAKLKENKCNYSEEENSVRNVSETVHVTETTPLTTVPQINENDDDLFDHAICNNHDEEQASSVTGESVQALNNDGSLTEDQDNNSSDLYNDLELEAPMEECGDTQAGCQTESGITFAASGNPEVGNLAEASGPEATETPKLPESAAQEPVPQCSTVTPASLAPGGNTVLICGVHDNDDLSLRLSDDSDDEQDSAPLKIVAGYPAVGLAGAPVGNSQGPEKAGPGSATPATDSAIKVDKTGSLPLTVESAESEAGSGSLTSTGGATLGGDQRATRDGTSGEGSSSSSDGSGDESESESESGSSSGSGSESASSSESGSESGSDSGSEADDDSSESGSSSDDDSASSEQQQSVEAETTQHKSSPPNEDVAPQASATSCQTKDVNENNKTSVPLPLPTEHTLPTNKSKEEIEVVIDTIEIHAPDTFSDESCMSPSKADKSADAGKPAAAVDGSPRPRREEQTTCEDGEIIESSMDGEAFSRKPHPSPRKGGKTNPREVRRSPRTPVKVGSDRPASRNGRASLKRRLSTSPPPEQRNRESGRKRSRTESHRGRTHPARSPVRAREEDRAGRGRPRRSEVSPNRADNRHRVSRSRPRRD